MDSVLLPCLIEGADDRDPSHQDQGFSLRQWLYFRDARDLELAECSFFETDIHFGLTGPTHELGDGITEIWPHIPNVTNAWTWLMH